MSITRCLVRREHVTERVGHVVHGTQSLGVLVFELYNGKIRREDWST